MHLVCHHILTNFVSTQWPEIFCKSHCLFYMLHANRNASVVRRVMQFASLSIKFIIESRDSCFAHDGTAWKVDGRTQALVGSGWLCHWQQSI